MVRIAFAALVAAVVALTAAPAAAQVHCVVVERVELVLGPNFVAPVPSAQAEMAARLPRGVMEMKFIYHPDRSLVPGTITVRVGELQPLQLPQFIGGLNRLGTGPYDMALMPNGYAFGPPGSCQRGTAEWVTLLTHGAPRP